MIEGLGVNTFRLLNTQGDSTYVKFHWRPKLGLIEAKSARSNVSPYRWDLWLRRPSVR